MSHIQNKPGLKILEIMSAWKSILTGSAPIMSIEVTRECPLSCPGCYAYGDMHLGGSVNLRSLSDYRGSELVDGNCAFGSAASPVTCLSGWRRAPGSSSRIESCPADIERHEYSYDGGDKCCDPDSLEWMKIPKVRVTISVDGLPEHHDVRRKPATYDRILKNIAGCQVNVHGTITRPMLGRPGYIEEFISFWNSRPEVVRIWISLYTPQKDEHTPEMLSPAQRESVAAELPALRTRYPKLLANQGISDAIRVPLLNRIDARLPECQRTIRLILQLVSSPAFSVETLTAPNVAVQSAAVFTGLKTSAWEV